MRLYLPRFYVRSLEENFAALSRDLEDAVEHACDCVLFPEQFLTAYLGEGDAREFRREFAHQSARFPQILMLLGTISEEGVNRQYVYRGGEVLASYDKVHLFLPNGEGDLWRAGDRYAALEYGDWRIGLCTCNDVRFPEQARALKLEHDINMLVYPSLWPWQRDQVLAALLRARAIENGCFSAGCCVAGVDNGKEFFDGAGNHVFDPLGNEVQSQDRVYELDRELLAQVTVDTRAQYIAIDETQLFKG